MPVYQGTHFYKNFQFKNIATDDPVDITGWTFRAQLRDNVHDTNYLVELTTDNGGFVTVAPTFGRFTMVLTDEQTAALPPLTIHFDVLRTDIDPGPKYLFGGKFKVKTPVTR